MQTVSDYRRNAQECRDLANRARDTTERVALLRMAETWDALANDRIASRPIVETPEAKPAA
jgi:hypothetical protein